VIDAKDGTVLGAIDLGGVPEQGVGDGQGMLYVVMQDAPGSVTAVDVKTMKATAHYPTPWGTTAGATGWRWMRRIMCCSRRARPREIRLHNRHSL